MVHRYLNLSIDFALDCFQLEILQFSFEVIVEIGMGTSMGNSIYYLY